ncbi:MAG: two-component sensor histidine kinase [Burkholderiales bacterium PBB1]|nr:MAG: two-component sensor histidine kinase [Burkholderiales bacterium PBB1]
MTLAPRSLQGRLLGLIVGLVVAVWVVTVVVTSLDARHELDELLDGHLAQAAALLVVQQASDGDDDDVVDAPLLHRYAPKVAFQVFHDGQLTMRSVTAPTTPMAGIDADFESGFRTVRIDRVDWRVFATRGVQRDVQVYVGEQLASREAILWAVLRSTLWPMAAALPLLAVAIGWAVHRGVAPLKRLGHALAQREPQALTPVRVDGAPSEMTPMLDALNGLLSRIGELMASERRFTADAAHELRTPIAAIRLHAQVAQGEAHDAMRQRALAATLEGCDRATRLVEQLLTLSRLEAGAVPLGQEVDLNAVVRGAVAELAPQAIDKQQSIEVDAPEPCQVRGDALLLAVLVRNLVDNAIRYSPAQGHIQIALRRQPDGVRLLVDDSGPGMSPSDMQRLGERFFRVLGTAQSGSGLGWSIVQRIAAVHRAKAAIGRANGLGGLSATVDWPLP